MPYKILSLDGGGSWAIIEAMTLGALYGVNTPGQNILGQFDLVAANSGGSIVLAGLAIGFTPQQLVNLLNDPAKRALIFVKNFLSFTGVEKYDAAGKLKGLRLVLGGPGDQSLNNLNLSCKLLIASFDYDRQRAQFFRSDVTSPAAGAAAGLQPTLAEAVHASSNAPVKYFDAPAQFNTPAFAGCRYWDGAMGGFNNPVMAAVTEALSYGKNPSDLAVLSIGTANVLLPMPSPIPAPGSGGQNPLYVTIDNSGLLHDLEKAAATIVDDPPDQASYMAHLIISGAAGLSQDPANPFTNGNVIRLNPLIQPIRTPNGLVVPPLLAHATNPSVATNFTTDQAAFTALVNLDMDATEQNDVDLITTLANTWQANAAPNQPIRSTSDLQPLIGHGSYSAAVTRARALTLVP
jgi:hypothetical protein